MLKLFLFLSSILIIFYSISFIHYKSPDIKIYAQSPSVTPTPASGSADWYMSGANPQRTSWVSEEVRGNLNVEWYQPIEPYIPYKVQPIFSNGMAYISTSKGLYAFDLGGTYSTGQSRVKWVYPTELPLGNSPTVLTVNGRLTAYVGGYDHKVHAIDATTGLDIQGYTPYEAQAGFETNPLVINDSYTNNIPTIYAGNRDGYFYALNAITGTLIWRYQTQGPILFSAAYKNGTLYFASNDMYAYALNVPNGNLIWKSTKLPGAGFHSYWPVIYTDKVSGKDYVIFGGGDNLRVTDVYVSDMGLTNIYKYLGTVGEHSVEAAYIFPTCFNDVNNNPPTCPWGDIVSATTTAPAGDSFWTAGTTLMDATKAISYFETYPQRRTSFILNATTGQEYTYDSNGNDKPEYTSFTLTNVTGSGNRYPAIVGIDGILYSANTYISDQYIPRGFLVGWKFGTHQISRVEPGTGGQAIDEPMSYASGGKLVYWSLCCDRGAGSFDITLPYGQNNRSWEYWSYYTLMQTSAPDYDPMYNDGDTTHYNDMNGWQVYAGKNQSKNGIYGKHGTTQSPPIPYKGKVYTLKGNTLIVWTPNTVSPIKLSLAASITSSSSVNTTSDQLKQKLEAEVQKIVTTAPLRPGYYSSGLYDQWLEGGYNATAGTGELLDYFQNPADTVYTLLLAYPYLSSTTQSSVKIYLQTNFGPGAKYDFTKIVHVGWGGAGREWSDIPSEVVAIWGTANHWPKDPITYPLCNWCGYWQNFPPFNFYAAWKYAQIVGNNDPTFANNLLSKLSGSGLGGSKLETPPSDSFFGDRPYILNLYIAGYEGFIELEKLAKVTINNTAQSTYDHLRSIRVSNFNKDIPLAWQTGGGGDTAFNYNNVLAVARNFMFLTPELADYLHQNINSQVQTTSDEYQYIAPYWFVSRYDNTYGEGTLDTLYNYPALFQAKAWILKQPFSELTKWVDVPAFQTGDLFYIQNLVAALDSANVGLTPTVIPTPVGDINNDGKIDGGDLFILLKKYLTTDNLSDLNKDGLVNMIDGSILINNFGK